MPSVLFVCTANQFRSPLAAARFEQLLAQRAGSGEWRVGSAGIWAIEGQSPPPEAQAVAASLGLNLEGHRTRAINEQLLTDADLIVVMTRGQQEAICVEFPETGGRVQLLSELSGGLPGDIPDPPSAPGEIPRIMHDVCGLVDEGFGTIRRLAEQRAERQS